MFRAVVTSMNYRPGDIVSIKPESSYAFKTRKAWSNFPGEYGYHSARYVSCDTVCLVLESREEYCRVLVDGAPVWIFEDSLSHLLS